MEIPTVAIYKQKIHRKISKRCEGDSDMRVDEKPVYSTSASRSRRMQMNISKQPEALEEVSIIDELRYAPLTGNVEIEFEDDDEEPERCFLHVNQFQEQFSRCWSNNTRIKYFALSICAVGYFAYFIATLLHNFGDDGSMKLIALTSLVIAIKLVPMVRRYLATTFEGPSESVARFTSQHSSTISTFLLISIYVLVAIVLIVDFTACTTDMFAYKITSLGGIGVLILLTFVSSTKPSKVKWNTVAWGIGLQFAFSLMILKWSAGYKFFSWMGDFINEALKVVDRACLHLFGPSFGEHAFAMQVLPFVIFASSLIAILFYVGAMEWMICKLAWIMQFSMGTTAGESICAAGNIFMGQTESPLLVKPIIHCMTDSEIHSVMTSGFATVAGGTMAAYILFGASITVPSEHLVSASLMSAPAALAISKIAHPESRRSVTTASNIKELMRRSSEKSLLEAAISGSSFAIPIVVNIAANLIAFISILEAMNSVLVWCGDRVGSGQPLTFQLICSYVLWPFALVMGVHVDDCRKVAQLIGIKTFINEFVAYESLSRLISNRKLFDEHVSFNNGSWSWSGEDVILLRSDGNTTILENGIIEERSVVISTYALCGFSSLCSIGVQIGAFSTLAPSKRSVVARLAVRAMMAGSVACFVTACVAGLLYNPKVLSEIPESPQ